MYLALAIANLTYVAVAVGVFGTLTVDEVIESGGTAIAVAAEPTLGRLGFWLMERDRAIRDGRGNEFGHLPGVVCRSSSPRPGSSRP
jgi:hypothetical protein